MRFAVSVSVLALACAWFDLARAGEADAADRIENITVTGALAVLGTGVDADKVPNSTRSLDAEDLARAGGASVIDSLASQIGSVSLNQYEGNPYQQDFSFRGFTASPVGGTPIGIAVYQNGIRVNEGFGDTVNWDLIPTFAIRSLDLTSSNPVFGLNALGGALALQLKNGFNFDGTHVELSGGSFGRHTELAEYGVKDGNWGLYAGINAADEAGWRIDSPSHVRQLYADLGYRDADAEIHLAYTGGKNHLVGTGPTPINLLTYDYGSGIDYPGAIDNTLNMVSLSGVYTIDDDWSLAALAYNRRYSQYNINGAPTSSIACVAPLDPTTFCSPNPVTGAQVQLTTTSGQPVPLSLGGAFPGENDFVRIDTDSWGGTLQATSTAKLLGLGNHLIAGLTLIGNRTTYGTGVYLGSIDPSRTVQNTLQVTSAGGTDSTVGLDATNDYASLYVTDTWDLTQRLSVTASAGYNLATIKLVDLLGDSLNGTHRFNRLNPSGGLTYKIAEDITAYANYSEDNRVPTPQELECADPSRPCVVPTSFLADPGLKQVVAETKELGLRGAEPLAAGKIDWNLSFFRADSYHDILSVPSAVVLHGYYQNDGNSRRQGFDFSSHYSDGDWRIGFDYSLLYATYQSYISLSSPFNPFADSNGNISVRPGNAIPGQPRQRAKLNLDYKVLQSWSVGASLTANSSQYLHNDNANLTPPVPGYAVLGLRTSYMLNDNVEFFANIENALDHRYYTFGVYTTEAGLPVPPGLTAQGIARSYGPGAPIGGWGGVRCNF